MTCVDCVNVSSGGKYVKNTIDKSMIRAGYRIKIDGPLMVF